MSNGKVRENRLRRVAKRRGYILTRCRSRDPYAIGYGGYMLTDFENHVVLGAHPYAFSADLDDVEEFFKAQVAERVRRLKAERQRTHNPRRRP